MKFGKTIASAMVATSLVSAPIVAQAAAPARQATEVEGENLHGGFIIPLLALAAVILGILALTSNDNKDLPHSP
jgi:hypothetical protein